MSNQGAQSATNKMPTGPPYVPNIWPLGGAPKKNVDIPITAVFLLLFIVGAVTHMTIFQINRRRGHKFIMSAVLFGFCMARIVTCVMRIAAISLPHNINMSIAAQVFTAAGVVLIYIINLILTQRIIRAQHPHIGWHNAFSLFLKALYALIVITMIMVITVTVQSFFTLNSNTRRIDRDIQLYGGTFFAVVSFLPIPLLLFALILPPKTETEQFGTGAHRTRILIVLTGSMLVCLGAAFRSGTGWLKPVPRTRPLPPYYARACFYVFNFVVEVLVVFLYAVLRFDLRFHIPNGAKGPGSYSKATDSEGSIGEKKDDEQ